MVTIKRLNTGLAHALISWSGIPSATRYIIYVDNSTLKGTTSNIISITSGLVVNTLYTLSIAPFTNDCHLIIPSNFTTTTITFSK